ncbi:MAG: FtsQ-type POTRA domain-containing protein [Bacilli bacterium]
MGKKKKKKVRLKVVNIFLVLLSIYLVCFLLFSIITKPINSIYVKGNNYLEDYEIIRTAGIEDYPVSITNFSFLIEKRLEKNKFIMKAKVRKKFLTTVYIEVKENIPILYDSLKNVTILKNGTVVKENLNAPILVNAIDKKKHDLLIKKLSLINRNILNKISEIKYDPDAVDTERFLLTMIDGNYVYVTLSKFKEINNYNNYVKEFNNKKGILYLNSGEYFKIMEN